MPEGLQVLGRIAFAEPVVVVLPCVRHVAGGVALEDDLLRTDRHADAVAGVAVDFEIPVDDLRHFRRDTLGGIGGGEFGGVAHVRGVGILRALDVPCDNALGVHFLHAGEGLVGALEDHVLEALDAGGRGHIDLVLSAEPLSRIQAAVGVIGLEEDLGDGTAVRPRHYVFHHRIEAGERGEEIAANRNGVRAESGKPERDSEMDAA